MTKPVTRIEVQKDGSEVGYDEDGKMLFVRVPMLAMDGLTDEQKKNAEIVAAALAARDKPAKGAFSAADAERWRNLARAHTPAEIAPHRAGWREDTAQAAQTKDAAYAAHDKQLSDAWKGGKDDDMPQGVTLDPSYREAAYREYEQRISNLWRVGAGKTDEQLSRVRANPNGSAS